MAKRRGNPNWGKPEPIGPVVPTITIALSRSSRSTNSLPTSTSAPHASASGHVATRTQSTSPRHSLRPGASRSSRHSKHQRPGLTPGPFAVKPFPVFTASNCIKTKLYPLKKKSTFSSTDSYTGNRQQTEFFSLPSIHYCLSLLFAILATRNHRRIITYGLDTPVSH